MAKKKGNNVIITLECTVDKKTRRQSDKNRKNTPERLELNLFNKNLRRHTLFREIKK
ncbi:MAG TPA: 50S ribosomal protein L33 [Candidatus Saccharimonas sp.]|nr:50S ribosomal protein L33 [Candidatus Saccharimonas sp.]